MSWRNLKTKGKVVSACLLVLFVAALLPVSAQEKRYAVTNLSGKLAFADGSPIVDATLRLLSLGEEYQQYDTATDAQGRFSLESIPYGRYVIEFTTAEGDRIHGLKALPVGEDQVTMNLTLSKRTLSESTLFSQPKNFQIDVEVEHWKPGRFFKQFGIFFAIVITGGLAVL